MNRISLRGIPSIAVIILGLIQPQALKAQAMLENPAPGSFQSGVGVISGWACTAKQIVIEIDGADALQAAYGTEREDTQSVCGDINNGFGLLVNWNNFADGRHTLRALADGKEFGHVTFTITTLGTDFLRGAKRKFTLFNFPRAGTELSLRWQESLQNFAIDLVKINELAALERLDLRTPDAYLRQPGKHIPLTFLLASRIEISQSAVRFSAAVPGDQNLRGYDATQPLTLITATGWEYVLRNAQLHASQFDAALLSALRAVPNSQRRLFFLSRADATEAVDVRYDQVCGP